MLEHLFRANCQSYVVWDRAQSMESLENVHANLIIVDVVQWCLALVQRSKHLDCVLAISGVYPHTRHHMHSTGSSMLHHDTGQWTTRQTSKLPIYHPYRRDVG